MILYIIILLLLFLAPVQPLDVAKLQPVHTVAIYTQQAEVVLETDTGVAGRGENPVEALAHLEDVTPGVIYLDTAEYLLVAHNAVSFVDTLSQYLHPSVKVCFWDEKGSVRDAAKYLGVMQNLTELRNWNNVKKNMKNNDILS